jgi:hypothetical protein
MLNDYVKKVKIYEAIPMLTEKVANVVYQEAHKTGTNLTVLPLPQELIELCSKSPERLDLYSRYKPSSQTRKLLMNGYLGLTTYVNR